VVNLEPLAELQGDGLGGGVVVGRFHRDVGGVFESSDRRSCS